MTDIAAAHSPACHPRRPRLAAARARPRPRLGARRRHRAGRRIHRLEFFGRQGRRARSADRLLGRRPALHLGRDDQFRGDVDGRRGRRPIRPGQAYRRPADGVQRRAVPGVCLHDAASVGCDPCRRPDGHGRGDRRVGAARLRRADDRRAGLAQLSRRADDAQFQLRHHRARLSVDPDPVLFGAAVEPGRGAASSASW